MVVHSENLKNEVIVEEEKPYTPIFPERRANKETENQS